MRATLYQHEQALLTDAAPCQTNDPLSVEEITSLEQFQAMEAEWNALVARSHLNSLFLRHEWFSAWWRVYGQGNQLFILLVRRNSELLAIAPLMLCRRRLKFLPLISYRQVQLMGNGTAIHCDFIIRKDCDYALSAIMQHLAARRHTWTMVYLRKVKSTSLLTRLAPQTPGGLTLRMKEAMRSPVLNVCGTWQSYYESRSKTCRKRIRLTGNRIQTLGQVTVTKVTGLANWQSTMPAIWEIGRNSPRRQLACSVGHSRATREFLSELSTIAAQRQWLNVWLLSVDDKPVAFEYHLRYENEIYALRAEYDKRYERYSPGFVLDCKVVENCFDDGVARYHMGGADNSYKLRWTSDVEPHLALFLYSGNLLSRLLRWTEFRLLPLLSRLSSLHWLRTRLKKFAGRIRTAYADHGLLGIVPAAIARGARMAYRANQAWWFQRDLSKPIAESRPAIDLAFQHKNPHATIKWMQLLNKPSIVHPTELAVAEKQGHYLVNIRHEGKIIGYVKVGFGQVYVQDFERVVAFKPGEAFIYDTFVLPEFRCRGVASAAIESCMRLLAREGYQKLYCHIPLWNAASIKAYLRAGFKRVCRIRYRRIMGISLLPDTYIFSGEQSR